MDNETDGIKSTASDLLRFVQANIDPSGLDPSLREAIHITHVGRFRVGGMVQGFVPAAVSGRWDLTDGRRSSSAEKCLDTQCA